MIKKIRSSKAFTLIEMLIVVAIIGILVGVGVPALRDARADAQARKAESVLANVATAKARYELDNDYTTIAAFNAKSDSAKFTDLQNYILVNGAPVAGIKELIAGTGYKDNADLSFGNLATYYANGEEATVATPPSWNGNRD